MFERSHTWQVVSLLTLFVVSGWAAGCSETIKDQEDDFEPLPEWTDERPQDEQELKPQDLNDKVFVNAEELKSLQEEKDATIIDARPLEDYDKGHYPGAVHSLHGDPEGFKPFKDPEYHDTVPRNVGEIQKTARRMGVFNDRPVVIYGDPGSKKAGRLFWSLEYLGHGEVHLYTPGYEALIDELDVEASTEATSKDGDFVVRRRSEVLATNDDVLAVAEGDKDGILIDTRRETEYTGEEVRAPRHGYIPNAEYYYWEEIFSGDGDFKDVQPKAELEQELEDKGLLEDGTVLIPYCQTGTRSAYVYAALRWLGAESARNYDGSWARYARWKEAPVSQDGAEKLGENS